ncbi:alpha-ketoacid dehydrogenase subunit beta [Enterocloster asparagiformis]|mgnify:CR=1 FL=1|nr:alpha-ketoacid dehydrogenase subunit beta [Enterocloster asparagiformis]UWO75983.1 alpha-ketoacid dehydrogenase subunit beta [[Clostridium] asparagiforme DSM 15981]
MRTAMKSCVIDMIRNHSNTMCILIDIGAFGFKDLMKSYPERVKNIGIFEDGLVGVSAGLALSGLVPTIYGITPFIVQRSLEQLKLDYIYQNVGGNFITTGAAYDFSKLGYSHYCPEDVETLKTLPGIEILTPGTPKQFETLFKQCYMNGKLSYFRMIDHCNKTQVDIEFGKAKVLKKGTRGTVIAFAEALDATIAACENLDITLLYYTTAEPFDLETLKSNIVNNRIFICEPFYQGTFMADIMPILSKSRIAVDGVGVPRQVIRTYGTKEDKDMHLGLTARNINDKLAQFLEKEL